MLALLAEWFHAAPGWTVLAALVAPSLVALLFSGRSRAAPRPAPALEEAPAAESTEALENAATVSSPKLAPKYDDPVGPEAEGAGRSGRWVTLAEGSEEFFGEIAAPPTAPAPSLASRLARTSEALVGRLGALIGGRQVDEEVLEDLTRIARVEPEVRGLAVVGSPHVILVLGVNGSGKTTTIGKLAARYARAGKRVVLGAGDTFRAAANEQLEVWAERVGCEIVKGQSGSDPAAVAFDTVKAAIARGAEVAIVDTAGRLQTKEPLVEELRKIARVIGRGCEGAPHETLLVLDANTGQNALSQARVFTEAVGVTGLVLTKLDGTAKGGVLVGLAEELGLPVRFVGVGEGIEDLRDFDAREFCEALFAQ
jgi:fused signal recognition particle receptor